MPLQVELDGFPEQLRLAHAALLCEDLDGQELARGEAEGDVLFALFFG